MLKVPKRENFLLAFFALSEPIWVGDLEKKKKIFFSIWPLISIVFGFLPHTECAVNKKKIQLGQNVKLIVVALEPICVPTMGFLKILQLWYFNEYIQISFFTAYSVDVGDFLPHTQ